MIWFSDSEICRNGAVTLAKLLCMQMQRRENDLESYEKLRQVCIIFHVLIFLRSRKTDVLFLKVVMYPP